ncbi:sensor domain-containing diguanylate cyclase [Alteribacter aurantiacus]|uniref:sensor domain-containing diguanylate cyclase n=1 Tax=Alteribacter aurantiacus TaxID=254410 RepID=UPI00041404E7|nr:sensor domain-containing diguanylate cyclase [Alteribacter aurantiacus]
MPTKSINFSKIFYYIINEKEESSFIDLFDPAILFIADKRGKVWTMKELGTLDREMILAFNSIEDEYREQGFPYIYKGYKVDAVTVSINQDEGVWDGYLGILLPLDHPQASAVKAFLHGFKQTVSMSMQLDETNRRYQYASTRESVHERVIDVLSDTDYNHSLHLFAKRLLLTVSELMEDCTLALYLYDNTLNAYLPFETTDTPQWDYASYGISEPIFSEVFREKRVQGFTIVNKQDLGGRTLFKNDHTYHDFVAVPISSTDATLGMLLMLREEGECHLKHLTELTELLSAFTPWIKRLLDYNSMIEEKKRNELLLKVNQKFYSSMDVRGILKEMVFSLHEAYPTFESELLLTHDLDMKGVSLQVKPLDISDDNSLAIEAYLTGRVQVTDCLSSSSTYVYVPLRGKQSIYGVLTLISTANLVFSPDELGFIQMFADTGGNAIENARLYEQSNEHITNLQMINKTAAKLNSKLNLRDLLAYMRTSFLESFRCDEVGFVMYKDEKMEYLNGSTEAFQQLDVRNVLKTYVNQLNEDGVLQGSVQSNEFFEFQSIIVIPMVHDKTIKGAVVLLKKEEYGFSFESYKLVESLVHHSTLAIMNAMLHEELGEMVIRDYLTKLYTRAYLDEKLTESMESDAFGSFILMDIDDFKVINDTYGHQVGDEVLIQVAKVLKEHTKDRDVSARWGGEEMALYLPKVDEARAEQVAKRIYNKVKEQTDPRVTISCGVSTWSYGDEKSRIRLFNMADRALYLAKNSGKSQVRLASELKE